PIFYKPTPATDISSGLVGSEMFIRHRPDGSDVSPAEITMATFDIEALCRGKLYKWVSGSDEPFNIRSYYEFYVTDKEYLTPDDAKDWKEHPETKGITVTVPDGVPELEPAIVRLIERVGEE
ncbi:MAG: hypothetical protein K2L57_02830, partial [Muribaculaceae bacterium]|nr:hypothetical protein [Muribaculaceae bacterium]